MPDITNSILEIKYWNWPIKSHMWSPVSEGHQTVYIHFTYKWMLPWLWLIDYKYKLFRAELIQHNLKEFSVLCVYCSPCMYPSPQLLFNPEWTCVFHLYSMCVWRSWMGRKLTIPSTSNLYDISVIYDIIC